MLLCAEFYPENRATWSVIIPLLQDIKAELLDEATKELERSQDALAKQQVASVGGGGGGGESGSGDKKRAQTEIPTRIQKDSEVATPPVPKKEGWISTTPSGTARSPFLRRTLSANTEEKTSENETPARTRSTDLTPPSLANTPPTDNAITTTTTNEKEKEKEKETPAQQPQQPPPAQPNTTAATAINKPVYLRAIKPHKGKDSVELSFAEGDLILFKSRDDAGWGEGIKGIPSFSQRQQPQQQAHLCNFFPILCIDGKVGWFPLTHVEEIETRKKSVLVLDVGGVNESKIDKAEASLKLNKLLSERPQMGSLVDKGWVCGNSSLSPPSLNK